MNLRGTPFEKKEWLDKLKYGAMVKNRGITPIPCISTWMDINGFGTALSKLNWDLNEALESGLIDALSDIYTYASLPLIYNTPPLPSERILILNDGISRTLDLYPRSAYDEIRIAIYVRGIIMLHYSIFGKLHNQGLGLRTVLSGGERIQYSPILTSGESLLHHSRNGPSQNGKRFVKQVFLYHPAEFQMNTGFSRSYIIDSSGSKYGVHPNRLYIDEYFLDKIRGLLSETIIIEGDRKEGFIRFRKGVDNIISIKYDKIIKFDNLGVKTKLFRGEYMLVHEYLEGETTDFPLVPNNIIKALSEPGIIGLNKDENKNTRIVRESI